MSIIQSLRDKSAVLLTGLIAISLLGFLVQDAFIGRTSGLMSGPSSSVGSINGTDIDAQDFNEKVRMMEESNRQQGVQSSEMMTQNIVENVWNTYIQENLIRNEAGKLGISFTAKEMSESCSVIMPRRNSSNYLQILIRASLMFRLPAHGLLM
jgi:peptidyl-prolyl cis-trans isomerase D